MDTTQILLLLAAAVLIAYMLYRAYSTPEGDGSTGTHGSSGTHGGGHTEERPDATGDPGSPSAE